MADRPRFSSEQPAGRSRRHLCRLSAGGLVAARTALAQAAPKRKPAARRLVAEGGA